ncbi:hypothetical protein ETD83_28395 [Actinomadura soli]|uniref:Uncharacterized protein n=1 Tax=Actinomadura soli TaxID=2508997 RepID=A0A5C4J5Y2_9ACTN|nr:hypothetical protein [Actinomadura soli]TMQ91980.1 hypothetical protein ETD83_28395 [Actinomadura soli]
MPTMRQFFVDFFCDFAAKAGTALDLGHSPPGTPQGGVGAYSLVVEHSGIFIEYEVKTDIKEFFIARMLCRW